MLVSGDFVCTAFRFGDNIITAKHCVIADEMVYQDVDKSYKITLKASDFKATEGDIAYTKRLPNIASVGRFVEVRHTVLGKELRHKAEVVFVGKVKELTRIVDNIYWLSPETEIILAKGISLGGMSGSPVVSNNRLVGVMSGGGAGFLIIVRD